MKHAGKRMLAILLAVLLLVGTAPAAEWIGIAGDLSVTAAAETYSGTCGDNLTWALDTGTGEMTISGSGEMEFYPDYDDDYNICPPWYTYRGLIKKINVSSGVTDLSDYAFRDCYNLTGIAIPNTVFRIGCDAFSGCSSLSGVTIPKSVTSIGDGAFAECTGLMGITVSDGNTAYSSDQYGTLYDKQKCTLYQYPAGNPRTSFTIPNSVTWIEWRAFLGSANLTAITIPTSVIHIAGCAFQNCTNLAGITIPNSVEFIGREAFAGCRCLKSVQIPSSVTHFGEGIVSMDRDAVFFDCTSLTSIIVDANNPAFCSDENGVVYNKAKTELIQYPTGSIRSDFTVPDSVKSVINGAFRSSQNLVNVTVPTGVQEIGWGAFQNCTAIVGVQLPDSVVSIDGYAFYGCTNLAYAHLPSGLTSIGGAVGQVFYGCAASFYICCKTANCYAKTYAEENGITFRVCDGHVQHEHSYTSSVTKEPTCQEEGVRTYTCACGDSYTEPIAKVAHSEKQVRIEPTCTESGAEYKVCQFCGVSMSDVTELRPLGHSFGAWVTVTAPTTDAEGLQERTCTRCGAKETEILPKIQTRTVEDAASGISLTYPETAFDGDVKLQIEQVFDGAAFNLVDLNSDKNVVFDVTTVRDGVAVQPSGKVTVRIPVPAGFDPAKCMVYHVSTETGRLEKMNARYENGCMVFETDHFSIYAIVIAKPIPPTVAIRNYAQSKTVDYRTTITFTADVQNPVSGGVVHWFIDGQDKGVGDQFEVKEAKKSYTVQAKYVVNGTPAAASETETVNVKTGFFARLKAFFRALFGKLPKVVQEYIGIERIDRVLP